MPDLTSLADLQPHPRNPRAITEAALAGLGHSIEEFGDLGGIVWNSRNGKLVCGHQRIKALGPDARMGCERVITDAGEFPVRVVDWDEGKHLAAMIVANSPHIAGDWLPELGGALDELAGPLEDTFFDLKLEELRADVPEGEPEPGLVDADEVPELAEGEPTTRPGDLWLLGEHRLLCGDATKAEDVARLMKGEKAAACITDPPYGIGYEYASHDDSRSKWFALMDSVVPMLRSVAQFVVIPCCGIDRLDWWYANHRPDWLMCWYKGSPGHRSHVGFNDWEAHLVWGKPPAQMHDYWQTACGFEVDGHPCPKPVAYALWLVERAAERKGIILDPFVGSGTTIIAAEQLGRRCYAMEIEPRYVDVAIRRWEQFTGLLATLEKSPE